MDKEKEKELLRKGEKIAYLYNGLSFQRKFGDLILWKQLVKEAKQNELFKSILFITDDDKEDWWRKVKPVNSRREKSIGPRPELVSEVLTETKAENFYMSSSSEFMKLAEKYLNITVKEESIKQVQDIVTALQAENKYGAVQFKAFLAEKAVFEWLRENNPGNLVEQNKYGPLDFVLVNKDGERIGYEVKYFHSLKSPPRFRLRETVTYLSQRIPENLLDKIYIVIVAPTEEIAYKVLAEWQRGGIELPDNFTIDAIAGIIVNEGGDISRSTFVQIF